MLAIDPRAFSDPGFVPSAETDKVIEAIAAFEKVGDVQGMAIGEKALSTIYLGLARWELSRAAAERGLVHALAIGDVALADQARFRILNAALWGPTPVAELLPLADETIAAVASTSVGASLISQRALAHALAGDAESAHADLAEAIRIKRELGDPNLAWLFTSTPVETVLGDLDAAEAEVRQAIEYLERVGETGQRSTMFGFRARNAFDLGRPDSEVVFFAEECRRLAAVDDMISQLQWRAALALVAARAGRIGEAKALIDEASDIVKKTDFLWELGLTAQDRGYIHQQAGETDDARSAYEEALALFEQKGDVMDAARVRERLASLR